MMAGPNGAGKSTVLARVNRNGLIVVSPDSIAHEAGSSRVSAGREALKLRGELFRCGISHVVDTTFSGRGELNALQVAQREGWETRLIYVGISSPELATQRVRERVRLGLHDVPDQDILRRYERSFSNLLSAIPTVPLTTLVDNGKKVPFVVAEFRFGSIVFESSQKPAWSKRVPGLGEGSPQSLSHEWDDLF
jgi:predicted ABC-type ATPase